MVSEMVLKAWSTRCIVNFKTNLYQKYTIWVHLISFVNTAMLLSLKMNYISNVVTVERCLFNL